MNKSLTFVRFWNGYSRYSINYTACLCFPMFSCSTEGSVSLSICHPLSPLTYFCLGSHSLLSPPPASRWPSNPLQHLATGPLGAGQGVGVQTNIRKYEYAWEEGGILLQFHFTFEKRGKAWTLHAKADAKIYRHDMHEAKGILHSSPILFTIKLEFWSFPHPVAPYCRPVVF